MRFRHGYRQETDAGLRRRVDTFDADGSHRCRHHRLGAGHLYDFQKVRHLRADLRLGYVAPEQPEGHIVKDIQKRPDFAADNSRCAKPKRDRINNNQAKY